MGTALRARARIQINLAVSQVVDIKQVRLYEMFSDKAEGLRTSEIVGLNQVGDPSLKTHLSRQFS